MDASRSELLGALASDAALERSDFLVSATDQLKRFLDANAHRITALGGMTLIDDDPDFLSIAPDLTFRSRSRYLDDTTGEWVSETEVIESAAELVELYNPADVYAAFTEAAREAAGLPPAPTGEPRTCSRSPTSRASDGAALDARTPRPPTSGRPARAGRRSPPDEEAAAQRLYDLALSFQERSQRSEARLLDDFADVATRLSEKLGDVIVVDDDDERLVLKSGCGIPRRGRPRRRRRRVAEPRQRRRDRRVLRPDGRLRRPGRLPWPRPFRRSRRSWPGRRRGRPRRDEADEAPRSRRRPKPTRPMPTTSKPTRSRPTPTRDRGPRPRVSMRLAAAELVDSREILPRQWLQAFHAPSLASGTRAGQFIHVRPGDFSGLVLRRPFSFNTVDPRPGSSRSTTGRSAAAPTGSPGCRPGDASTCSGRSAGRSRSTRAAGTCC